MNKLDVRERRLHARRSLNALAELRETGQKYYPVKVSDLSRSGCSITGIWNLATGARVWLRLPGLEGLGCRVAWSSKSKAGLEFDKNLHAAVLEWLIDRHPGSGEKR